MKPLFGAVSTDRVGRSQKTVTIELKVSNLAARALVMLSALALFAMLIFSALVNCMVGMLTDTRVNPSNALLIAGIGYVPNSAPLNARLAESEMEGEERDIVSIQKHATLAVNLSPWDYRNRLLLATVEEAAGDRAAAEQLLQEALALAPNYTEVRWRLANLLLREGKLAKAVVEFRAASASSIALLPGTLDLLSRVSAGSIAALQAATPPDPKSRLLLAQFLLKQSRASDAITVFSGIDRDSLVALSESPSFISSLIADGRIEEARGLWVGLVTGTYAQPGRPLPGIWNGSFESDISKSLTQFDWAISRNEYAVPDIDFNVARTGSRSLRIDFTGRDTARLDGQVKEAVVLKPGARYRLECYAKSDHLETPEGPRVVVTDTASATEIAASEPLAAGSNDWRRIAIDFTAPASARAAAIAIKRIPKFSYDNPTRGSVWFDDFVLIELAQ